MKHAKRRTQLEKLLAHLERRTAKVESDLLRRDGPVSADFEEQAVAVENDEVLSFLHDEGHHQIDAIRSALARMDDGSYGVCVDCGGDIQTARINALPYATTCIACATKREQAGR